MFDTDEPLPQEKYDQQLKQASDRASVLQLDELIQAADRERHLQMQFDDFKRRSAPLWEQEMKQRDSRFTYFE